MGLFSDRTLALLGTIEILLRWMLDELPLQGGDNRSRMAALVWGLSPSFGRRMFRIALESIVLPAGTFFDTPRVLQACC
ncbi:hypothetical protein SAMN04487948_1136 [Halogranum amylolyticum]|uniref:Uncharacterized protein n=1 Tax=Halogranum amylolyticum TaxID=660520 RepID=A0A1H8UWD9_9EURY|nr:hypothetical protein SAMN04487948_1136 [Halogranum amylolyticum]